MKRPDPILVGDRFAPLRERLIDLLAGLSDEDWNRQTAAPRWTVKDVTAHLLGGDLGNLSRRRDRFQPPGREIRTERDLVELIDGLNESWVAAARRLSPRVLRELLAYTAPQMEAYFLSLHPHTMGGPVSWAGPDAAPVWLDVAREFTERWHHQQQIRDATGRPPLYDRYFLGPVLDAFVRALPFRLRDLPAVEGTLIRFTITGEAGGTWFVLRTGGRWELVLDCEGVSAAEVAMPQDTAWRMFTKGVDAETARQASDVGGDVELAAPIFRTIAIIGWRGGDNRGHVRVH